MPEAASFAVETYWTANFGLTQPDIDYLKQVMAERKVPISTDELALHLIRYRVNSQAALSKDKSRTGGQIYRPEAAYQVGDRLVFPLLGDLEGEIAAVREGQNPAVGAFSVIKVHLENGDEAEFVAEYPAPHPANDVAAGGEEAPAEEQTLSAEEIFIEYGGSVSEAVARALRSEAEVIGFAAEWLLASHVIDVNEGFLNLAEAILDMNDGGPLAPSAILSELGMFSDVPPELAAFSLNWALRHDDRFDEVGPTNAVRWFLTRMEPGEVLQKPEKLAARTTTARAELPQVLADLARDISDELSADTYQKARGAKSSEVTLSLIYPHLVSGTLPISLQLKRIFPGAEEAERVRFTLYDTGAEQEIAAWAVAKDAYVYGLKQWFEDNGVTTGSYITLKRTNTPGVVDITLEKRSKPRMEWVPTLSIEGENLRVENKSRPINCDYDDLMIIGVENADQVGALARRLEQRENPLERLVEAAARALILNNAQGNMHARTLYSLVNVIYRCPPESVFSALLSLSSLAHAGGPYWHLRESPARN